MAEQFDSIDELNTPDRVANRVRRLAGDLLAAVRAVGDKGSGLSAESEGADPEVLPGLSNSELKGHEDPVSLLRTVCRLLVRLGDTGSLRLASKLSYKIRDLERDMGKVSHFSDLYRGISQIGLRDTEIGIRNVLAGFSPVRGDPISPMDRCMGCWALASAALAGRNVRLALKYAEEWLQKAEESKLSNEPFRAKMAMQVLHLLLGDVDRCSAGMKGIAAFAPEEWKGAVAFLDAWTDMLAGQEAAPVEDFSEPLPLFLGLDWHYAAPGPDNLAGADFSRLCGLRRKFAHKAALKDGLSAEKLMAYANLLARWELLRPFREAEEILKETSPGDHFDLNIARILGRHALEYAVRQTPAESDVKPLADAIVWMMDVRDFSKFCEEYSPEAIFEILGPLFKIMHEELEGAGGTIHEFVGDSIMVVFNTFGDRESEGGRGPDMLDILFRSMVCLRRIHVLSSLYIRAGMPELRIGVGINKGPAATGYLGGLARCHLAVMGSTVNIAARIEQVTKQAPGAVLVSRTCFDGREPDVWSTPQRVNFSIRDVGQLLMKNIANIPPLYSVKPLLQYWVDFVPMGHVAQPQKGVVYLDTGNSAGLGVIDHHFPGQGAGSACELLIRKPQLLLGHLQGVPPSEIELRVHEQPDLDCAATLYAAYELMDREPREGILRLLADYVNKIDQGIVPQPEMLADSLYGIFVAHQKIVEQTHGAATTDAMRLEAGLRVIDAAFYLMERSKQHGDFAYIFRFEPGWFAEERRLIKQDRARYDEDWELRSLSYSARVRGAPAPVEGLWLDHPQSILFKLWARTDRRSEGGEGYGFLAVDWSEPEKDRSRFVVSVAPEAGTSLKGLGALLESEESAKRKRLGKERPVQPVRYPSDNSDPWYFGWSHDFTIVDSPRGGTILTAEEVRKIHESWAGE